MFVKKTFPPLGNLLGPSISLGALALTIAYGPFLSSPGLAHFVEQAEGATVSVLGCASSSVRASDFFSGADVGSAETISGAVGGCVTEAAVSCGRAAVVTPGEDRRLI